MKNLTVQDIITCTKGELVIGDKNSICNHFSKDTRTIQKGDMYIGIKGEKFDGNIFWKQALDNGAMGVIVQEIEFEVDELKRYNDKVIIKVKDTLEALYAIASYKRQLYDIPVVAITGSVGKTSTKDIVANVVSQKYHTVKTIGNNNNNIGLPFTILNAPIDMEAMVLEMGMNHFGEIHLLSEIAKPNICIITNIGTSHIGNLGSRENILKAKLEILDGAKEPYVVINNDNDLLHKWYEENKNTLKIKTYGIYNTSDIQAKSMDMREEESSYIVSLRGKEEKMKVPVGGEHFILNSMLDTKDYPELTEQEMENFLSIINGSPTDTTCYDTHELNSFSYIWKNSTLDVKVKEMQTKKRNSDSLKIRVGVALLWGGLAYMHFLDEAYLNAIGDISTLLLYQLIFNISEHETDNVKKYEKISYIFKWMMSCGLLSGLEQHHLTLLSGMFVGFYYVASRFFRNCAEVEKSYQKTR